MLLPHDSFLRSVPETVCGGPPGQLFSFMDSNRSDTISWNEFRRGVAMAGVRPMPPDTVLRELFDSLGRDKANCIRYTDMVSALQPTPSPHRAASPPPQQQRMHIELNSEQL